jgi:hypothetical protein
MFNKVFELHFGQGATKEIFRTSTERRHVAQVGSPDPKFPAEADLE